MTKLKYLLLATVVIFLIFIGACNQFQIGDLETAKITLNTGINPAASRAAASDVSSFRLNVTAEGMTTVEQSFSDASVSLEIEAGPARTFTLQALDTDGNALFSGSKTIDLTAGESAELMIELGYAGFYVSFQTNGGSTLPVQYVQKDGVVNVAVSPVKDDFILAGWYADEALTNAWDLAADAVVSDMTLYAKWLEIYTVTFDSRGGTAIASAYAYEPGSPVEAPVEPIRADYSFSGWYTAADFSTEWDFADDVTSDMTLYALWDDSLHSGYLELDGIDDYFTADSISNVLAGSNEITIECSIYPAAVNLDQYFIAFNGSDYSNGLQLGIRTDSNLKFYNPVSDTAVDAGADAALSANTWYHVALTIDSGNNINMYLDGVNVYSGILAGPFSPAADDLFSIGQEWDGGPAASNFFSGRIDDIRIWQTVRTQTEIQNNIDRPLIGNESGLLAYYECTDTSGGILTDSAVNNLDGVSGNAFTVTYESNGGSAVSSQSGIPGGSTTSAPAAPARTGYSFSGWYEDDGTFLDAWSFASDTVTADITLYAYWTPNTYTIQFNGNGSDGGSMTNQPVDYDQTVSLTNNSFTRTGYTFFGWNTASNGSGTPYSENADYTHTSAGDVDLYAQWDADSYSIIFDGNGATGGSMSDQPIDYDETLTLYSIGYTHSTLYFAGWNTESNGSGDSYTDGGSYTHTTVGDETLYAQWSAFTTATFTNAGATGANGPIQTQLNTAYSGTILDGAVTNPSVNDGYQLWTVPASGTYRIEARGAQGAVNYDASYTGANGAVITGDFNLTVGDQLIILVGQQGSQSGGSTVSSAGGGGTFVTKVDSGSSYTLLASSHKVTPLIVAGGGGGVGGNGSQPGVAGTTAINGTYDSGGYGTPGTSGYGGLSGSTDNSSGGGGAGGFIGDGTPAQGNSGYPGLSFLNGGTGGQSRDGDSYGGFGGGGGNHNTSGGGGAGGGYSGGTGGQYYSSVYYGGGGGGSYNSGSNQSNTAGVNTGHGSVIITLQ